MGVALVKPSLRELRDLLQRPLNTVQECGDAAFTLVQQGAASTVAVSMGEQGAVLAHRHGVWHAPALEVPATSLSFHLKELVHSGLVSQERQGRNLVYRAAYAQMNDLLGFLTQNCCQGQACLTESTTLSCDC